MSKYAVLGSPIAHSKSPIIHSAAYRVLGETWQYERFEVGKGGLKRFVEASANQFLGFSVTMPLKEDAFNFAHETDELSKLTKASNTLVKVDHRWLGFNTDTFGITQAVSSKLANPPKRSLIIGSGSTATSAVVAISKIAPASEIQIFARNTKTRRELIQFANSLGLQASRCMFLSKGIARASLTVSTLPSSVLDLASEKLMKIKSLVPGGLLLDVAYHPWPSKLASYWMAKNRPVVSGLEMLIWQAVSQIRIFRNGTPDLALPNEIAVVEAMRLAASE